MSNEYIFAKAARDLDDVSKSFKMLGKLVPKKKKAPAPMSDGDWKSTLARGKNNPFSDSNIAMSMKPMANPFSALTGGPKTVQKSNGVAKGFLTPVKGIKGGAITRRFPDFTSSGKRQLAAKKTRAVEGLAASRSSLGSSAPKPFDSGKFYREKNAASAAASRASDARIKASQPFGRKFDPQFNAKDR